jgi:hypothetical protein
MGTFNRIAATKDDNPIAKVDERDITLSNVSPDIIRYDKHQYKRFTPGYEQHGQLAINHWISEINPDTPKILYKNEWFYRIDSHKDTHYNCHLPDCPTGIPCSQVCDYIKQVLNKHTPEQTKQLISEQEPLKADYIKRGLLPQSVRDTPGVIIEHTKGQNVFIPYVDEEPTGSEGEAGV